MDFIGNSWADMFAKWGAQSHAVADVLVDFHKSKLVDAKAAAKVFSWMVQVVAQKAAELVPRDGESKPPAPRDRAPELALTSHELWVCARTGEHRCVHCNHFARTPYSLRALRASLCSPTPAKQGAAERFFALTPDEFVPARAAAVEEAMRAASAEGVAPLPTPLPLGGRGDAVEAEVARYRELGHQAEQHGRSIICLECGAYVVDQGRNPKLSGQCLGRSKVASTRSNERAQVSRALRGCHPRTGAPLPAPPGQGAQPPPAR